jgi:hypothetical protein
MFRQAGLGPLIGKRSWGGVVGISGRGPLIDGGTIYVPTPEEKAQFVEVSAPIYDWYTGTYGSEWLDVLKASIETCQSEIAATQASFLD